MKKTVFMLLLLLSGTAFINGETGDMRFKHISLADGLSQSTIFCMIQDKKGFLWFGTQEGLNRYDGYDFIVYKPDPDDASSISDGQINWLLEDSFGNIWIATISGGLNRFDPRTEKFRRYRYGVNEPNSTPTNVTRAIAEDKKGDIWVGTNAGLTCIIRTRIIMHNENGKKSISYSERFVHYFNAPGDEKSLSPTGVSALLIDKSGTLWIGTLQGGLSRYNEKKNNFDRFIHIEGDPTTLLNNGITAIYEDSNGMLWVGTAMGLHRMDRQTGKFEHFIADPDVPGSISGNTITSIYEDRSGVLWIGTLNNGINRFNRSNGTFTSYTRNPLDPNSLSNNTVFSILEDKSRILWIGTSGGGLNKYDRDDKFKTIKTDPGKQNQLIDNFIYSVMEDRNNDVWIGTNGSGLDRWNRKKNIHTYFRAQNDSINSLGNDVVRAIYQDRDGIVWIGTAGGGLNKFNPKNETFTRYEFNPANLYSISNSFIRAIFEDSKRRFWIGTIGSGLNRFDRESGVFIHYFQNPNDPTAISGGIVYSICESKVEPGILWIGTGDNGLNRFDPESGIFWQFTPSSVDHRSLSHLNVQYVYEDHAGNLWIATYGGGLNKLIREKDHTYHFIHYTEKHGLPSNALYGILEDEKGHLWISTNKGLTDFDPKTLACKNYNVKDGLQGNEFNGGAFFKSNSGEMFFGGIDGLNMFFPSRIKNNPTIPPVVITAFRLFNQPTEISPASPLRQSITWTKELHLGHRENIFSFEFSALDFTVPDKNNYAYKMENFDEDWVFISARKRFASYTKLPPGRYTFRVKASNNDGVWNNEGVSLRIIIHPPFWRTIWFNSIMVILGAALFLGLYLRRLKNVRIKAELQTAHDAQMSIMPQADPRVEGFDISGICVPAYEVGGDFFDYIWMNEEKTRLGIAIGDVSGKAMKSAMTAVMTSGMIYMKADESSSVKEILRRVNRPLYFKTGKNVFTALCLAALDIKTKDITFTNAGLSTPLLKKEHSVIKLEGEGNKIPLGVKPDMVYLEKKYQLDSGDVLIFFTDGVPENKNNDNEFYGYKRLIEALTEMDTALLSAADIKKKIISGIKEFAEGAAQYDDMTVVVVKVL